MNTPRGIAYALSWNGGMQNVRVQLIDIDRGKLDAIKK